MAVFGLVAVVGLAVVACGSDDGAGSGLVTLAELSDRQESYDGLVVATSGVVVRFEDHGGVYYVIEDDAHNRVRVEPADRFTARVGDQVVVTGRFAYDETRGRTLTATQVRPPT